MGMAFQNTVGKLEESPDFKFWLKQKAESGESKEEGKWSRQTLGGDSDRDGVSLGLELSLQRLLADEGEFGNWTRRLECPSSHNRNE